MFQRIVDNCYGNIFVTDNQGKIIYLNESSADSLGLPRTELLKMSIYDLVKQNLVENAASIAAMEKEKMVFRLVPCKKTGHVLATISNPVFGEEGKLEMTVTYSQTESKLNNFIEMLEEEKEKAKFALSYLQKRISDEVIAESKKTKDIFLYAKRIAMSDSTAILFGESGTGKEVLARYIHKNSHRKDAIFLPINCASIPAELMEAEFFGYERGAFTGALKDGKPGIFEVADKGTLFLDEIGELPLSMQSKLLRVLGSGEIIRVGGNNVKSVNVRIVAATNRNLWNMTKAGTFREDLYYRLNIIPITLPPLRERREDILPMSNSFLDKFNRKYTLAKFFHPDTEKLFVEYNWPGNIRELKNVIERLVITSTDNCLRINRMNLEIDNPSQAYVDEQSVVKPDYSTSLKEHMEQYEAQYINKVITDCEGNISMAAEKLGVHRSCLYKKINKLAL
jgi:transcriptional regulator with PAS, ATPase and Fis domain